MPKYCLDTSGFSNPLIQQPEDVYVSLWCHVRKLVSNGVFCWNAEIAQEFEGIYGATGDELRKCNGCCCFEINENSWNWEEYLSLIVEWQEDYKDYISEYNSNRKNTIGLNDLSIVAFAKTMGLPLISEEKRNPVHNHSKKRLRIPNLCDTVGVQHLSFVEFLQAEKIKL